MSERGLTLIEITVVLVLAGVVTLGIVGFYLNSQATWIGASSQAMAQRDATTLLEAITQEARPAGSFSIIPVGTNSQIFLIKGGVTVGSFGWDGTDSLVHKYDATGQDLGPVVSSRAEVFHATPDDTFPSSVLRIDRIQLRGVNGEVVSLSSSVKLYNAP